MPKFRFVATDSTGMFHDGTIDAPDARYTGPTMPDSVVQAMIAQDIVTADAPPDFQQNAVWRCMAQSIL